MELGEALTRKSHAPLAPLLRKAENEGVRFLGGDSSRLFEVKDAPASKLRASPWAELLSLRENVEPTRAARDSDLFARITLGRLLASFRSHFETPPASWRRSGG